MATSKPNLTDSSDASNAETDSEIQNLTNNIHSDSFSNPDSPTPFSVGQKVLALHKNVFYAAKVLHVRFQRNEFRFQVHYLGWKARWDEWLGLDSLLEHTEENLQKCTKQENERGGKVAEVSASSTGSTYVSRGKKRKNDSTIEENDSVPTEKHVSIPIPSTLKKQLVDDCEFVNTMGKLVKLPRIPNVNDIFVKYVEYREQQDGLSADSIQQFMRRFQAYFDKALPAMLLYKSERQQFEQATVEGTSPSSLYGAEHLLRLLVKFPELLSEARNDSTIEEEELVDFQQKLIDLVKFLRRNQSAFFLSTYNLAEDIETSTTKKQDDLV